MDASTITMAAIAAALLAIAYWRSHDLPLAGLKAGARTFWSNLPLLLLSFAVAGLARVLIPPEIIRRWLGEESGWRGILVGCIVGGLVPGAPYAVFPVVGALYTAGAGIGAVVGFVSAWSLWSVTRIPLEVALIGPRVTLIRMLATLVFPPLAGLIAQDFLARVL